MYIVLHTHTDVKLYNTLRANCNQPANQHVSFLDHSTKPYNATSFNEYVLEGSAPVLPETLRLFKKLISLGIKPVLLTGRC